MAVAFSRMTREHGLVTAVTVSGSGCDRLLTVPCEDRGHQERVIRSVQVIDNLRQDAAAICNDRGIVFETNQPTSEHTVARITLSRDPKPESNAAHKVSLTCTLPSQGQAFAGHAGAQHRQWSRLGGDSPERLEDQRSVATLLSRHQIERWSGRRDSNSRPSVPKTDALPDCATPRTKLVLGCVDGFGKAQAQSIRRGLGSGTVGITRRGGRRPGRWRDAGTRHP